ncbi:helix-turn-helix domain-containing protein [Rikenella microfusus]|uniref:helix-turn-helix domain-containing protein n=1 Tax=Rikenella microfusus TaxID=28139 RepID=UPI003A923A28
MEETATPYELPDTANHSFFFVDARIPCDVEAKLHRHDAWELLYVTQGHGNRAAGDTWQPFSAGDAALIPPCMLHRWEFAPDSADARGNIGYLMVAFSHAFVTRCTDLFPEVRNRLAGAAFPDHALKFGRESARTIGRTLARMNGMDELGRLSEMFRLLPVVFTSADRMFAGKPARTERDVRRMQQICTYVMRHYAHPIPLDEIAAEVGMNRSAFCTYFKRCKGMTFSRFVTQYRLNTACELLEHSRRSVSEICYMAGFNDLPHFVRVFTAEKGMPPTRYRKNMQGENG